MNREIKFKIWNKRLKKFFTPYTIHFNLGLVCVESENKSGHTFGFIDVEMLQFTGLKDKNGTDIYEGDIVASPHFKTAAGQNHKLNHIVKWSDRLHGWFLLNCDSMDENDGSIQLFVAIRNAELEIIGNIFENPELKNDL